MTGVSFVVTVYNKKPHLPRVLKGLFGQEGDFAREFIIIDDGSTDGSAEVLDRLCAGRKEVRVVHQPNAGLVGATNAGVRLATLPWLKLVDGDDVLAPWCGRLLLDAASALDAKVALGTIMPHYPDRPLVFTPPSTAETMPYRRDLFSECLMNVPCNVSPTLIDRAVYWAVGGADPRLTVVDLSLFLRLTRNRTVAAIDAQVCACPQGVGGRMSDDQGHMLFQTNRAIIYFLAETPDLPWRVRRKAVERAFGRAWKWRRRRMDSSFASRWFWLYALAKLGPPSVVAPFLASTLEAFGEAKR